MVLTDVVFELLGGKAVEFETVGEKQFLVLIVSLGEKYLDLLM